jgi:hypothetical protein
MRALLGRRRRADVLAGLAKLHVPHDAGMMTDQLVALLRAHITAHAEPAAVALAASAGHRLLIAPQHHTELLPLHRLWTTRMSPRVNTA